MSDVDIKDIKKDGTFIDENGNEQIAVSLDAIFGMIGGANRKQPNEQIHPTPNVGKKKPTNRGIKIK